jgi:hypothetical protein
MHGGHDAVFDIGGELGGAVVVDHGTGAFVAAFFEDAAGGDVAGDVVGVAIDPHAGAVKFAFDAEGVVDGDFAGEEDHGHVVAEAPALDEVGQLGGEFFAVVETGEILLRVIGDGGCFGGGEGLPFFASGEGVEGEFDLF